MKKYIYLIFTVLSALLLLASCHQEEEIVVKKPSLKVVSSNVIFGVEGGQGTIVVESDAAVSVTSERPWAQTSVSGNTITVTVSEQNPSHMSRYSRLTISDGSSETYVTVHQYGEIFDGMDLADLEVEQGGTTLRYAYKSNMPVQMASDQPWVHFAQDEENEGVMIVTVDENPGFGTRFATVSFTAGSNTGSMKITQEPKFAAVEGWKVEDTDGWFDFPDQVDVITVTPPAGMEGKPYFWATADPVAYQGVNVPSVIRNSARQLRENHGSDPSFLTKGTATAQVINLPSTVLGVIICFDDDFYPTGEYALVEVSVPDRGPVKQQVDGWEIAHTSGTWTYPTQTDEFTITPKEGYEEVKYIATVVKKSAVADVEDFAFTNFAMSTREEILGKVASGELASFEAGLSTGTTTLSVDDTPGDVYVVVVAFGDNKFYTGDYTFAEIAVPDLMPTIYRWVGSWKVARKNNNYDTVDTWEISVKEQDKTLRIVGMEGFTNLERYDVEATADEEGRLVVKTQYTGSYEDSSRGHVDVLLSGQYTNVQGKTYYTSSVDVLLFTGVQSEDGNSAELVPGTVTSAGEPATFSNFQFYGRYKTSSGSTSAVTWNASTTPLPQTITRVVE